MSLFYRDILKYYNYKVLINKREYGNGINDILVEEILKINPDLIISVDHGSSNGPQIDRLMDNNIKCIITDHHEVSLDTPPNRYNAFINPQRDDCKYDKSVSGCSVAYLLILSLCNRFNIDAINNPHMQNILAITSITTISDAMNLNTITNRAIVKTGLKIANSLPTANWKRLLISVDGLVNHKVYGWQIAPRVNSCSRMGDPDAAYKIFIEKDDKDIQTALAKVEELNNNRKSMQDDLTREADDEFILDKYSKHSAVSRISKGLGIQGIIANRFASKYKTPSIIFVLSSDKLTYQGSGRSYGNINILDICRDIEKKHKDKVLKCGGHKGAAGITITVDFYEEFKRLFEENLRIENEVSKEFDTNYTNKDVYKVDMELNYLDYSILDSINLLAPYGQAWEEPLFSTIFRIKRLTNISRYGKGSMYILNIIDSKGTMFETTYYPDSDDTLELKENMTINIVYSLEFSSSRGKGLSIQIKKISEY